MSGVPFHQTRMGHTFFDATVPRLVEELVRLNDNLERALQESEGKQDSAVAETADVDVGERE